MGIHKTTNNNQEDLNTLLFVISDYFTMYAHHSRRNLDEGSVPYPHRFFKLWKPCCRFTRTSFHKV